MRFYLLLLVIGMTSFVAVSRKSNVLWRVQWSVQHEKHEMVYSLHDHFFSCYILQGASALPLRRAAWPRRSKGVHTCSLRRSKERLHWAGWTCFLMQSTLQVSTDCDHMYVNCSVCICNLRFSPYLVCRCGVPICASSCKIDRVWCVVLNRFLSVGYSIPQILPCMYCLVYRSFYPADFNG